MKHTFILLFTFLTMKEVELPGNTKGTKKGKRKKKQADE